MEWWKRLSTTGKVLTALSGALIVVGLLAAFGVINFGAGDALVGAGGMINKSVDAFTKTSLAIGEAVSLEGNAAKAIGGITLGSAGVAAGLAVRHKLNKMRTKGDYSAKVDKQEKLADAMRHQLVVDRDNEVSYDNSLDSHSHSRLVDENRLQRQVSAAR